MTYPYIVTPNVPVPAVFDALSGTLRATLPSAIYDRKLTRIAFAGPSGTRIDVYQNTVTDPSRLDSNSRGQTNTADYPNPIFLQRGVSLIAVWTKTGLTAADTANATFYVIGA